MNRPGNLSLVLILALASAAAVGVLLFAGGGESVDEDPGTGSGLVAAGPGPAAATPLESSQQPMPTATPQANREAVPVASKPGAESDPDFDRHMAGFTGRVVGHDDKPVANCAVELFRFDPAAVFTAGLRVHGETLMDPQVDAGEAMTDSAGKFAISGTWPRSIYALIAGANLGTPSFQMLERSPGPAEVVDLGTIRLKDSATLTGIVVGPDGEPVAGALVRGLDLPGAVLSMVPAERIDMEGALLVRQRPGPTVIEFPEWVKRRFAQLPIPQTRTDESGKFRLKGLEAGSNFVAVTTSRYTSFVKSEIKLKAGQEKDIGTLKLSEGETAFGRVLDTNGKPVAGAEILVAPTSVAPVDFAQRAPASDAEGKFRCGGLPQGRVTVAARRSAKDPWTIGEPQSVNGDLVVKLPAVATLTVTLRSKIGQKLDAPKLRLLPGRGEPTVAFAVMGLVPAVTLDGRTQRLEDGRLQVTGFPQGTYILFASCAGHADAAQQVDVTGDKEITLEFEAERQLRVRVVDGNGAPIRRAAIYTSVADPRMNSFYGMPVHGGTTASDGTVTVVIAAPAQKLRVTAMHPAFGSVHQEANLPTPECRLQMLAPGGVAGVLTEKGGLPEPGKWMIQVQRAWSQADAWGALPETPRFALVDAEGRFAVGGLRPGKWRISAEKSIGSVNSAGGFYQQVLQGSRISFGRNDVEVEVASGLTAAVNLDTEKPMQVETGPAAQISGTAMINGRPAEGMSVYGWSNRQIVGKVDASGRFDLGRVREGDIHLQLMDMEKESRSREQLWSASIRVKANQDRELRIDVQLSSVTGIVYGGDGQPAAGVDVSASVRLGKDDVSENQWSRVQAKTDALGRFEMPRVPAGDCTFQAEHKDAGRSPVCVVPIQAGVPRTDIELRLQRTLKLKGTVDMSHFGGKAPEWLWLHLQVLADAPGGNREGRGAMIGADGAFEVTGLFAGRYEAVVNAPNQLLMSTEPIELGQQDREGVTIRLKKRPLGPPPIGPKK